MLDKNGVEIRTGDVVRVTGAYFKNDNGLFMVERSPGDIGWSGGYHSLMKISKTGKISTAKYNLGSWPIAVYVSNWAKPKRRRLKPGTPTTLKLRLSGSRSPAGWPLTFWARLKPWTSVLNGPPGIGAKPTRRW